MPEVKVTYIKQTSQRNVDNKGMNERESVSTSVVSNSLHSHGLKPARLLCPWDSPGQNTGVGRCSPLPLIPHLQGIFPTQGLNPGFLHSRWILYHLSHQGSSKYLNFHKQEYLLIFKKSYLILTRILILEVYLILKLDTWKMQSLKDKIRDLCKIRICSYFSSSI